MHQSKALSSTPIEKKIYLIRNQKVMIDCDLAQLYQVNIMQFNQAIKRNISRFPTDLMFQLTKLEFEDLKVQMDIKDGGRGGRRKLPYVFTEIGIAMISSVLRSERAIQINLSIMRIFIQLRNFHMLEKQITNRVDRIENGTNKIFKIVFERLNNLENDPPSISKSRRKIGLNK